MFGGFLTSRTRSGNQTWQWNIPQERGFELVRKIIYFYGRFSMAISTFHSISNHLPSGKLTQLLIIIIEIVSFTIENSYCSQLCKRLPEGKFHKQNPIKPSFSYGFPIVFPLVLGFFYGFPTFPFHFIPFPFPLPPKIISSHWTTGKNLVTTIQQRETTLVVATAWNPVKLS